MKKITKLTGFLAALTLIFALGACANGVEETKDEPSKNQKNKEALESIEGTYYFDFEGDYKLDECINANLKTEDDLRRYFNNFVPELLGVENRSVSLDFNSQGFACSSVVANNAGPAGGKIYGRNFDYPRNAAMVVHTKPAKGYESVSTCYPAFVVNSGEFWKPENEMEKKYIGASSIFVPLDGMNEKGFYISILQLDSEDTNQTAAGKHDIQTTVAVRYLLDNADSVAKALEILDSFNMHNVFGTAYHFAMADTTGESVVVEYVNNIKYVAETKVVTNHYLCQESGRSAPKDDDDSLIRYNIAMDAGEAADWNLTPEQVRDVLKDMSAKQYNTRPEDTHMTIWSAVYEPSAKKVTYYFREDYTKYAEVTFGN